MQTAAHTQTPARAQAGGSLPSSAPAPQRRRRKRSLSRQILCPRDPEVLRWLAEQYAGRIDHIAALLGCSYQQAQRVAGRLVAYKLARYQRIMVGEPTWVIPTTLGLRFVQTSFKRWSPKLALLQHYVAINDVRLYIEHRAPEALWTSERQLAHEQGIRGHLPDGMVIQDGQRIAIEVELTVKPEARLRRNIELLVHDYYVTLYYAAPAPHKRLSALLEGGGYPSVGLRELPGNGVKR
jgi:hypothetical protein